MGKLAKQVAGKLLVFKAVFHALMFVSAMVFAIAVNQKVVTVEFAIRAGELLLSPICLIPFFL